MTDDLTEEELKRLGIKIARERYAEWYAQASPQERKAMDAYRELAESLRIDGQMGVILPSDIDAEFSRLVALGPAVVRSVLASTAPAIGHLARLN